MQGISGTNMKAGAPAGNTPAQAPDSAIGNPGGGTGGLLTKEKDATGAASDAQFGDLWKQLQTRYGAKADKPREIKKNLGKDDFLKIMITQMKNQDPSKPFDADQMAAQMAQFASVEQLQNLNQSVGKMVNNGQPLERLAMTNLIGKTVTIDRERFTHNENETSALGYGLVRDAKNVKLKIISEQGGEAVFEKDLGPQKAGEQTFVWDGMKTNGLATKAGGYIYKIEAVDVSDRPIAMESRGQSKVVGVAFDGPEGTLLVGDAKNPQKITMRNVVRIDTSGDAPAAIPGARSMASALQGQGVPTNGAAANHGEASPQGANAAPQGAGAAAKNGLQGNWIQFQKGEGSKNLDSTAMNADARKALEAYESASAAKGSDGKNVSAEKSEKTAEKGFPSGLSSDEN
jgi:flagellar basal-body rod modification protein FlgD